MVAAHPPVARHVTHAHFKPRNQEKGRAITRHTQGATTIAGGGYPGAHLWYFSLCFSISEKPVGIELEAIPPVKSVLGWDLVLYEPHMTEPKFPEKGGEFVIVEDWVEEPNLNDDRVCDLEKDDFPVRFK